MVGPAGLEPATLSLEVRRSGCLIRLCRADRRRAADLDVLTAFYDPRRALWPDRPYGVEPLFEHGAETARSAVLHAAQLISQTEITKNGNRLRSFRLEAAVGEPHV